MPANIARSHDEFLRADSRFHFALHHVGNRFMRVGVKRGADSRRIVDLEERHFVTLDKRLDEHIAAIPSGHQSQRPARRLWANNRLMRRSKLHLGWVRSGRAVASQALALSGQSGWA
jgi:hypothetical protein